MHILLFQKIQHGARDGARTGCVPRRENPLLCGALRLVRNWTRNIRRCIRRAIVPTRQWQDGYRGIKADGLYCYLEFKLSTNETGPLPLCTFSVMGLSMCSSIFSESSPVRSKSCITNELSGFPNYVPIVRCSYASSSWHGHTGHAYCICFVGKH